MNYRCSFCLGCYFNFASCYLKIATKCAAYHLTVYPTLVKKGEVDITSTYKSLNKHKIVGDFRFVVIEKVLSRSHNLSFYESFIMAFYKELKKISLSEERGFGLDLSFVTVEKVPLMLTAPETVEIHRVR